MPEHTAANPLLTESTLLYRLPPFAEIEAEHYPPAFEMGMAGQLAEIDAILAQPDPPTFHNTVEALERSGQLLHRATLVFFSLISSMATPRLRELETEYAPRLAAHQDAIMLNRALFGRVGAVFEQRDAPGLTAQERALIERYHTDFVLAGAGLDDADQARLRAINQRISVCSTRFAQNLQSSTESGALLLTDREQLGGMSEQAVAAAASAAEQRGHPGGYLLALLLPSGQPALAELTDRAVRERLWRASVNRASSGEDDNGPLAIEIARLRAERAGLLGFATHADAVVSDQTAGSTAAIDEMLSALVGPAVTNARSEAARLAVAAARDGIDTLQPWDWAFYAERVRADEYAVDSAELRQYLELDRVLVEGVFRAANLLYGITFTRRAELAGYHPDVRVYEVFDTDGEALGLYLGDYFAREGKRGGAWMNSYVDQSELFGSKPVVANNLNLTAPAGAGPALLTPDEVDTLFHEFGHALHGLFSDVRYPRLSGTKVPRDFVEFPSQVNEMWARWPEVFSGYAVHHQTGERLPARLVESIEAASSWGEGFATTEYLAAALLDQAWHRISADESIVSAADFERQALEKAGIAMDLIPPRYRTTYFQHIFSGAYSAGYYAYIWSEVLDADTVRWFGENGGLRRENGDVFRSKLLSVGGSVPAMDAFRAVLGRDPDITPLLRRRNLLPPGATSG